MAPRLILLFLALAPGSAHAAELLMLEQRGCAWCKAFDAEIAPAYPKTAEGRRAPLRKIDIDKPWPEDLSNIRPERFTPTFVLVDDGVEIARLRGYPGADFFWSVLEEMLEKLPTELNRPAPVRPGKPAQLSATKR